MCHMFSLLWLISGIRSPAPLKRTGEGRRVCMASGGLTQSMFLALVLHGYPHELICKLFWARDLESACPGLGP